MTGIRSLLLAAAVGVTGVGIRPPRMEGQSPPVLDTARHHPMQYYVSLPRTWTLAKRWPVVVVAEGGNKAWVQNAQDFARVRDARDYPFIIVTPLILTNGGSDLRHLAEYNYSSAVWDDEEKTGRCAFDLAGVAAVADDVRERYGGEDKFFLTGHSAGGHLTWAFVLRHPEKLRGATPVVSNYTGRCMTSEVAQPAEFSSAPERVNLPVKVFDGENDPGYATFLKQHTVAINLAREHGYRNVVQYTVPGGQHARMPEEVLPFFYSLLKP